MGQFHLDVIELYLYDLSEGSNGTGQEKIYTIFIVLAGCTSL